MATDGYSDLGEEWSQKFTLRQDTITRNTTVEVLLYDDATDGITDSDDVGNITTELSDGNYTRQTVTLDSSDISLSTASGDLRAEAVVTFDLTNTTGTFDAFGLVNTFQSDIVLSEGSANPHLIGTGLNSGGSQDATNFDSFEQTVRIDLN